MTATRIFLILLGVVLLPNIALASPWTHGSFIGDDLCDVAGAMVGELAVAIGTIAVCSIGVLACLGRIQWTSVLVMVTGIVVLFGAVAVVDVIGTSLGSIAPDAHGGCS